MKSDMRIICCGNPQRGDDAAGVLVAERLRELGVEAETCTGEAFELIDKWRGVNDVIVVDAIITGERSGTVRLLDARGPVYREPLPTSTHGFSLVAAIELARSIGALPERLLVYGIEGRRFEIGSEISPEVQSAVEKVVQQIVDEAHRADIVDSGVPKLS